MNGIRLAAFALAALGFLQLDMSEASAQGRPDMGGFRGPPPGVGQKNQGQEQPQVDPPSDNNERSSRSSSRSRRSSRSSRTSNNAIKTNPLFQFLDVNGDGELSLEEIDAASRMLYSLDANEDDAITADEVEDMAVAGGAAADEDDGEDDRSTRSSRSSSDRSSRSSSSRAAKPKAAAPKGGKFANGGGMAPGRGMGGGMGGRGGTQQAANEDFGASDKNEDGFLTRGEMPRSLRTKFTKMDANGDKEIDEDEWYDYMDNQ